MPRPYDWADREADKILNIRMKWDADEPNCNPFNLIAYNSVKKPVTYSDSTRAIQVAVHKTHIDQDGQELAVGKIYYVTVPYQWYKKRACTAILTGLSTWATPDFLHLPYVQADFQQVYPWTEKFSYRLYEINLKEDTVYFNRLLAKQVARGLCHRIPEDCAGIIERMLVGDKIVGKGPDRYEQRL